MAQAWRGSFSHFSGPRMPPFGQWQTPSHPLCTSVFSVVKKRGSPQRARRSTEVLLEIRLSRVILDAEMMYFGAMFSISGVKRASFALEIAKTASRMNTALRASVSARAVHRCRGGFGGREGFATDGQKLDGAVRESFADSNINMRIADLDAGAAKSAETEDGAAGEIR